MCIGYDSRRLVAFSFSKQLGIYLIVGNHTKFSKRNASSVIQPASRETDFFIVAFKIVRRNFLLRVNLVLDMSRLISFRNVT